MSFYKLSELPAALLLPAAPTVLSAGAGIGVFSGSEQSQKILLEDTESWGLG